MEEVVIGATQKKYFDYNSRIESKTSAELPAVRNGIGVNYGCDKLIIDSQRKILTLSNKNSGRYITKVDGTIMEVHHCITAPDGITAVITEDLAFSMGPEFKYGEYLVYASHTYVESEDIASHMTFHCLSTNGNVSNILLSSKATIDTWNDLAAKLSLSFHKSTSVILGYIIYSPDGEYLYSPRNNEWPTPGFNDEIKEVIVNTINCDYVFGADRIKKADFTSVIQQISTLTTLGYRVVSNKIISLKFNFWFTTGNSSPAAFLNGKLATIKPNYSILTPRMVLPQCIPAIVSNIQAPNASGASKPISLVFIRDTENPTNIIIYAYKSDGTPLDNLPPNNFIRLTSEVMVGS